MYLESCVYIQFLILETDEHNFGQRPATLSNFYSHQLIPVFNIEYNRV